LQAVLSTSIKNWYSTQSIPTIGHTSENQYPARDGWFCLDCRLLALRGPAFAVSLLLTPRKRLRCGMAEQAAGMTSLPLLHLIHGIHSEPPIPSLHFAIRYSLFPSSSPR